MPANTWLPNEKIEILLLEGVHSQGIGRLKEEGFSERPTAPGYSLWTARRSWRRIHERTER